MKTARKAIQLLKQFSVHETQLGVSELSRRLDMDRASVHRMLQSLRLEGVIEQDQRTRLYRLGATITDIALAQVGYGRIVSTARPHMARLSKRTGEGVALIGTDGNIGICIAYLEGRNKIRVVYEVGERLPLHSTASGLVLLAHMDAAARSLVLSRPLDRVTPLTVTDPAAIEARCAEIAPAGIADLADSQIEGARAIAAPVRDMRGKVPASVVIALPTSRFPDDDAGGLSRELRRCAEAISTDLASPFALTLGLRGEDGAADDDDTPDTRFA